MSAHPVTESKLINEYAPKRSFLSIFQRWEWMLVALIAVDVFINMRLTPYFLDARNLSRTSSDFMEIGLMMLPMVFIIITGNIDPGCQCLTVEKNVLNIGNTAGG